MPKHNPCAIIELGRIKNFNNVTLLSHYLKVDTETVLRWRRGLKRANKPMIKYWDHIMIDFEPG